MPIDPKEFGLDVNEKSRSVYSPNIPLPSQKEAAANPDVLWTFDSTEQDIKDQKSRNENFFGNAILKPVGYLGVSALAGISDLGGLGLEVLKGGYAAVVNPFSDKTFSELYKETGRNPFHDLSTNMLEGYRDSAEMFSDSKSLWGTFEEANLSVINSLGEFGVAGFGIGQTASALAKTSAHLATSSSKLAQFGSKILNPLGEGSKVAKYAETLLASESPGAKALGKALSAVSGGEGMYGVNYGLGLIEGVKSGRAQIDENLEVAFTKLSTDYENELKAIDPNNAVQKEALNKKYQDLYSKTENSVYAGGLITMAMNTALVGGMGHLTGFQAFAKTSASLNFKQSVAKALGKTVKEIEMNPKLIQDFASGQLQAVKTGFTTQLKDLLLDSGKEGVEELMNMFSEKTGSSYANQKIKDPESTFSMANIGEAFGSLITMEGVETFLMGAYSGGMSMQGERLFAKLTKKEEKSNALLKEKAIDLMKTYETTRNNIKRLSDQKISIAKASEYLENGEDDKYIDIVSTQFNKELLDSIHQETLPMNVKLMEMDVEQAKTEKAAIDSQLVTTTDETLKASLKEKSDLLGFQIENGIQATEIAKGYEKTYNETLKTVQHEGLAKKMMGLHIQNRMIDQFLIQGNHVYKRDVEDNLKKIDGLGFTSEQVLSKIDEIVDLNKRILSIKAKGTDSKSLIDKALSYLGITSNYIARTNQTEAATLELRKQAVGEINEKRDNLIKELKEELKTSLDKSKLSDANKQELEYLVDKALETKLHTATNIEAKAANEAFLKEVQTNNELRATIINELNLGEKKEILNKKLTDSYYAKRRIQLMDEISSMVNEHSSTEKKVFEEYSSGTLIDQFEANLASKNTKIRRRVNLIEEVVEETNQDFIQSEIDQLEKEIEKIADDIRNKNQSILDIENELEDFLSKAELEIQTLNDKVRSVANNTTLSKKQRKRQDRANQDRLIDIEILYEFSDYLQTKINNLKEQNENLKNIKEKLQERSDFYKKLISTGNLQDTTVSSLEKKQEKLQNKISRLQAIIDNITKAINKAFGLLNNLYSALKNETTAMLKKPILDQAKYIKIAKDIQDKKGFVDNKTIFLGDVVDDLEKYSVQLGYLTDIIDKAKTYNQNNRLAKEKYKQKIAIDSFLKPFKEERDKELKAITFFNYINYGKTGDKIYDEDGIEYTKKSLFTGFVDKDGNEFHRSKTAYSANPVSILLKYDKKVYEALTGIVVDDQTDDEIEEVIPPSEVTTTKEETLKKLDEVLKNKDFIELRGTGKNTYYFNTKTGTKLNRVTKVINDEIETTDMLNTANALGTQIDGFVRDFFDGTLKPLEDYKFADNAKLNSFLGQLQKLKDKFDANGESVYPKEITLYNDKLGVAGTIDLLTVDNDGRVRIYDMKTMRKNMLVEKDTNEVILYDSTEYGETTRSKHAKQLSLYRILLNNTHGLTAVELGIIPIKISYKSGDTSVKAVNLLDIILVTPLETVDTKDPSLPEIKLDPKITIDSILKSNKDIEYKDLIYGLSFIDTLTNLNQGSLDIMLFNGYTRRQFIEKVLKIDIEKSNLLDIKNIANEMLLTATSKIESIKPKEKSISETETQIKQLEIQKTNVKKNYEKDKKELIEGYFVIERYEELQGELKTAENSLNPPFGVLEEEEIEELEAEISSINSQLAGLQSKYDAAISYIDISVTQDNALQNLDIEYEARIREIEEAQILLAGTIEQDTDLSEGDEQEDTTPQLSESLSKELAPLILEPSSLQVDETEALIENQIIPLIFPQLTEEYKTIEQIDNIYDRSDALINLMNSVPKEERKQVSEKLDNNEYSIDDFHLNNEKEIVDIIEEGEEIISRHEQDIIRLDMFSIDPKMMQYDHRTNKVIGIKKDENGNVPYTTINILDGVYNGETFKLKLVPKATYDKPSNFEKKQSTIDENLRKQAEKESKKKEAVEDLTNELYEKYEELDKYSKIAEANIYSIDYKVLELLTDKINKDEAIRLTGFKQLSSSFVSKNGVSIDSISNSISNTLGINQNEVINTIQRLLGENTSKAAIMNKMNNKSVISELKSEVKVLEKKIAAINHENYISSDEVQDKRFALVIERLKSIFKGVNIVVGTDSDIREKYPEQLQGDVPLSSRRGWFDSNTNTIFINRSHPRTSINTIIHEFAHPFIKTLKRENKELYENILATAKKMTTTSYDDGKEQNILDYVKKKSVYDKSMDEEIIAIALEEMSKTNYSFNKDNTKIINKFAKLLTDMFNYFFGSLLKSVINPNTNKPYTKKEINVELKNLESNMSLSHVSQFFINNKFRIDLSQKSDQLEKKDLVTQRIKYQKNIDELKYSMLNACK